MNEKQKENIALVCGLTLCLAVFSSAFYQTYISTVERTVEFRVFEVDCWDKSNKVETLVMTNGTGKYIFLGNWTGQFIEGSTYTVTFVQQRGSALRIYKDLIVIEWREIE